MGLLLDTKSEKGMEVMSEAGWGTDNVTAERIRDTLREQGNVLSPYVVAQCIDDLLKSDAYAAGRVAGLKEAEQYALTCVKELQDKIRDIESGQYTLVGAQTKEGVEEWVHAKTLQANRIAKWMTSRIAQIEAQAQGGMR